MNHWKLIRLQNEANVDDPLIDRTSYAQKYLVRD